MRRGKYYTFSVVALTVLFLPVAACSRPGSRAKGPNQRPPRGSSVGPKLEKPTPPEPRLYVPPPPQTEKPFHLELAPGISMEFMWIPPGTFMMGDPSEGIPRHEEKIARPFYMGKTEVTQQQWMAVMSSNPSAMKRPHFPVHRVQRADCDAFVKGMNEKYGSSGMVFALPTEAQWEYACRAGNAVKIDTPDDPERIGEYAWLGSNSQYEPHPVAQKKPNDWGLYDMQGNVAEWCSDVLSATEGRALSYPGSGGQDPTGEPWYVVRGGNYRDGPSACTSTARVLRRDVVALRHDGLRLVCTPKVTVGGDCPREQLLP